jgi:hypothetical protein
MRFVEDEFRHIAQHVVKVPGVGLIASHVIGPVVGAMDRVTPGVDTATRDFYKVGAVIRISVGVVFVTVEGRVSRSQIRAVV